jgi:trk system potassium uptake protein TrkA
LAKSGANQFPVLVIGLGHFGTSVARSLGRLGHDILAVDESPEIVQKYSDDFTHVLSADSTDTDALRQIGAEQFGVAVVGIGDDIEASVLTVLSLVELGIKEVWAKAVNAKHARILERVGATHVIRPESAMGERVAHMVTGTMIDYIEFDDGFSIARTRTPEVAVGRTLGESQLRRKYAITVVGVKRRGEDFTYATPETDIVASDELIVSGPTKKVEAFCSLTHS